MLPSVLARQLKKGISDYVLTTFPITETGFKKAFDRLVNEGNGLFHEPYITIKLPFKTTGENIKGFEAFSNMFIPYVHQQKAFDRLVGSDARSTLIATGTGSGKTECFLYPILEHCYQHRDEKGIKALLIYPMNALASDQAKRIANLIDSNEKLKNNVTVGMYVGGKEQNPNRFMKPDGVITDRYTMLSNPPDILMTNYKMLDYLLVRPQDANLWNDNNPETLKYIAVDEIHTFDGAQGTDLACLLRRLKSRLYTPIGHLCCIGTSATMGNKDAGSGILEYAKNLFGEPFEDNAVILEERKALDDFLGDAEAEDFTVPTVQQVVELREKAEGMDEEAYLVLAAQSWLNSDFDVTTISSEEGRIKLGMHLLHHKLLKSALNIIKNNFISITNLTNELAALYPVISDWQEPTAGIEGILALVSYARSKRNDGKIIPFLTVQEQLWLKELRRLEAKLGKDENINFSVSYDLDKEQERHYLPIVNCRECGATGWITKYTPTAQTVEIPSLEGFYTDFFNGDGGIKMLFPCAKVDADKAVCPDCMHLQDISEDAHCNVCGHDLIYVKVPNIEKIYANSTQYRCPFCGSDNGISLIGMRSATEISAGLSLLFSSKFNDDKKLLAFSDNVQDAALRAGFFNARTWHVCFRTALFQFLSKEGRNLTFSEFNDKFNEYWRREKTDEEYISLFLPSGLVWMRPYENMKTNGVLDMSNSETKTMFEYLRKRLEYETYYEFGKRSDIGRTLEKSLCATLKFDLPELDTGLDSLLLEIQNEIGELRELKKSELKNIIAGILFIMRRKGALSQFVNDLAVCSESFMPLTCRENNWMPYSISKNNPVFLANKKTGSLKFDLIDSEKTWYYKWLRKYIEDYNPYNRDDLAKELLIKIISFLTSSGCLKCYDIKNGNHAWGINSAFVKVTDDVVRLTCSECGQSITVPKSDLEFWQGCKCLRAGCREGILKIAEDTSINDYYGKLYKQNDIVRIFASEHTGLLQRDGREELEKEFKETADRKPWYPNLLSCTPTLEMGIDIGDLSTVVMCSVPPAASQYIQRSGRGGRKDGNALNITVANSQPHDLYYYSDPLEMIQGKIVSPRIFLNASAVLERQFIAYCMDNWVKDKINQHSEVERYIPSEIRSCLNNIKKENRSSNIFPFNFIEYIKNNVNTLNAKFVAMFSDTLSEDTKQELKTYILGSGTQESDLTLKITNTFKSMNNQRESIKGKMKLIKSKLKALENGPEDSCFNDDKGELKSEWFAYNKIVRDINKKNIFNFLSDEGLLPNYAFPEEGISLQAVLLRKENNDGSSVRKRYDKLGYEYRRSASTAISEFAPENTFYAEGHKLTIDAVDLNSAETEKWRLCPNCSHAEIYDSTNHDAVCPSCGSQGWSDNGQVVEMLKVKLMSSTMNMSDSIIEDEVEGRRPKFYCKDLLVDIKDDDIVSAYKLDNEDVPFGYEFVKKATLREVNFGEISDVGTETEVAGKSAVRKGFKICKHCGTVQTNGKQKRRHSPACKLWKHEQDATEDDFINCLFLYREFQTEALRILIPDVGLVPNNIRCESFVAAFMLGLKEHFGNVDHLRATVSDVASQESLVTKRYLVVYDSVPGGTGYLKQLMNTPEELMEVFEKSISVMENCECRKDKTKHGCYKCLFAYRQSRNIGEISNEVALKLLKQIVSNKDKIVKIDKISSIPVNGLIESELEELFVDTLQSCCKITRQIVGENNKDGYYIVAGDCTWEMEPQVNLNERNGVFVPCKPDFILRPKGVLHNTETPFNQRAIAVFTDGFLYHKDIVHDDTRKRMAVFKSEKYRVWSLTWKDVKSATQPQGNFYRQELHNTENVMRIRKRLEQGEFALQDNTFKQLIDYLKTPNAEDVYAKEAVAQSISFIDNDVDGKQWIRENSGYFDTLGLEEFPKNAWMGTVKDGSIQTYTCLDYETSRYLGEKDNFDKFDIKMLCVLEDRPNYRNDEEYERDWNGFLTFANIMQFLPGFYPLTRQGFDIAGFYDGFAEQFYQAQQQDNVEKHSSPWDSVYDLLLDEATINIAKVLAEHNVAVPEIGYEIVNDKNTVVAETEMAWEQLHIALILKPEEKLAAENEGWKVYTIDNILECDAFKEADK